MNREVMFSKDVSAPRRRRRVTMFPEETHQAIVKQVDDIEAELLRLYRKLARLRLDLQQQWKVLPSGRRWSQDEHEKTEHL